MREEWDGGGRKDGEGEGWTRDERGGMVRHGRKEWNIQWEDTL